jgi:hypothetical protein
LTHLPPISRPEGIVADTLVMPTRDMVWCMMEGQTMQPGGYVLMAARGRTVRVLDMMAAC